MSRWSCLSRRRARALAAVALSPLGAHADTCSGLVPTPLAVAPVGTTRARSRRATSTVTDGWTSRSSTAARTTSASCSATAPAASRRTPSLRSPWHQPDRRRRRRPRPRRPPGHRGGLRLVRARCRSCAARRGRLRQRRPRRRSARPLPVPDPDPARQAHERRRSRPRRALRRRAADPASTAARGLGFVATPITDLNTAGETMNGGTLVDFNRDGKLDVAVAIRNRDTVRVYLGDGTGGLGTTAQLSPASARARWTSPRATWTATAGPTSSPRTAAPGPSRWPTARPRAASSTSAGNVAAGSVPTRVALSDLDHNGILDLAVLDDSATPRLTAFGGQKTAPFFDPAAYPATLAPASDARGLVVGAFSADGRDDLAVVYSNLRQTWSSRTAPACPARSPRSPRRRAPTRRATAPSRARPPTSTTTDARTWWWPRRTTRACAS